MSETNKRHREWLHWTAATLGIIGAGAGIPASFMYCFAVWQEPFSVEMAFCGFWWVLRWAVLLVAYIRPLIGGVVLIIDSSLLATFYFLPGSLFDTVPLGLVLATSLPLLASGVLFLISWRERQRESDGNAPSDGKGCQDGKEDSKANQYS